MTFTVKRQVRRLVLAVACALPLAGQANMGNIAINYGLLPSDMASAQALSLFSQNVSAVYYNPAYLAEDGRGELTLGLLHGEHELRAISEGGSGAVRRDGEVLDDTDTQQQMIGMKTNLADMSQYDRPFYLGVMIGVEKYGREMMAFSSESSQEGQFLRYGRQPLFLNIGGMLALAHGIDVGVSALVMLHSEATLRTRADTDGTTWAEEMTVSARPSVRPILGVTLDWTKLFCGAGDCFANGWQSALSYRTDSRGETSVDATTVIPGLIPDPGLNLAIMTIDSYQPDIFTFGTQYRGDRWRLGITLERQLWSHLENELDDDTVRDQGRLEFGDILIPRAGFEYRISDHMLVTTGIAREESPLESETSPAVNYFDNDRVVIGLGAALELEEPPFLAWPLRLDFGYQYHRLQERDFELTRYQDPNDSSSPIVTYETVTTEGDVHVFSGSLTLKF